MSGPAVTARTCVYYSASVVLQLEHYVLLLYAMHRYCITASVCMHTTASITSTAQYCQVCLPASTAWQSVYLCDVMLLLYAYAQYTILQRLYACILRCVLGLLLVLLGPGHVRTCCYCSYLCVLQCRVCASLGYCIVLLLYTMLYTPYYSVCMHAYVPVYYQYCLVLLGPKTCYYYLYCVHQQCEYCIPILISPVALHSTRQYTVFYSTTH